MLKLAIESLPYEISTVEFNRQGKSYTFDTLNELKKIYPNDRFYLIIGADQFLTFDKWYRYRDILDMVTLCTSARETEQEKLLITNYAKELGIEDNYYLSTRPVLRVSSSQIRNGVKNGSDVSSLLPKKVLKYILEKGLYGV